MKKYAYIIIILSLFIVPSAHALHLNLSNWASFPANITITEALTNLSFDYNSTNYTIFNESLLIYLNMQNISELDENDTRVQDLSMYNRTFIFNNSFINSSGGKYGAARRFTGNSSFGFYKNTTDFSVNGSYTLMFWFNFNGANMTSDKSLTEKWSNEFNANDNTGPGYAWAVRMTASAEPGYNYSVSFAAYNGTSSCNPDVGGVGILRADPQKTINVANHPNTTTWRHYAAVMNKPAGTMTIFLDGINSSQLFNACIQTATFESGRNIVIGGRSAAAGTAQKFNGSIDEFILLNRTMSPDEIKHWYTSSLQKHSVNNYNFYINESKSLAGNFSMKYTVGEGIQQTVDGMTLRASFTEESVGKQLNTSTLCHGFYCKDTVALTIVNVVTGGAANVYPDSPQQSVFGKPQNYILDVKTEKFWYEEGETIVIKSQVTKKSSNREALLLKYFAISPLGEIFDLAESTTIFDSAETKNIDKEIVIDKQFLEGQWRIGVELKTIDNNNVKSYSTFLYNAKSYIIIIIIFIIIFFIGIWYYYQQRSNITA